MSTGPSGLQRFRRELKRRKVYRTFAAYAVGAFGAWQVADIVGPALGWPDAVLTYLVVGAAGFAPIVLALAWSFDIRRETGVSTTDVEGVRLLRPPLPPTLVVGTVAVVTGGLLVWVMWPGPLAAVADFRAGDRTVISRCTNATGDPTLEGVLNTALAASIRQSSYVEIVSHAQVRAFASSYMGLDPATPITQAVATDYAIRTGLKVVIHCSVGRLGDQYLVGASIDDPREGIDLVVLSERSEGSEGLLSAIDKLADEIRTALGESLRTVRDAKPLAIVTTSSLDALISYTASLEAEARGDSEEMRRLLEQALSRDSLFARAHAGLAIYHYFRGNIPVAEEHYRTALRDPDRVSERDRMWIEASQAADRRDYENAITLYSAYLERWPNDADGWYNLGTQNFRLTLCEPAREAFRKALSLNPALASAYVNAATCLADLGKVDSAIVQYDSAFGLRPSWRHLTNLNHEFGQLLVAAGRWDEAESLFSSQFGLSQSQEAQGRRSLGLLRTLKGRYRDARPLFEEAARLHQALGQGLSEYRTRVFLLYVLEALGEEVPARREWERIQAILGTTYVSPAWSYHAFRFQMLAGDVTGARGVLARSEADTLATGPEDRGSIGSMRAWVALAEGRKEEALAEARLATAVSDWDMLFDALCQIALGAGDQVTAEEACGELAGPGMGTGWEGQEPSILAEFFLGEVAESRGDPLRAQERYSRFLRYWGEGDTDLRFRRADLTWVKPIEEARHRLARLNRRQR